MSILGNLGNVIGTVVLKYKADTAAAEKAVRGLAGEQKKAAKEVVQSFRDQQAAADLMQQRMVKGFASVGAGVAIAISGFKKYEEAARLGAATAAVDMDRLNKASNGLLTNMEAMRFAAETSRGTWKLTTSDMEAVLGAARALSLRGIMPLGEAAEKLGEAVKKGEIEPLRELGIVFDENLAKTDKRAAAMKALQALSAESARATTTETEAVQKHGVEFRNAMDQIEKAIGQIVVALGPLIGALGEVVGLAGQAISGWATIIDTIAGPGDNRNTPGSGAGFRVGADLGGSDVMEVDTIGSLGFLVSQKISRDIWERDRQGERNAADQPRIDRENRERARQQEVASRRYAEKFKASQAEFRRRGGGGGGGYELGPSGVQGEWVKVENVETMVEEMFQARLQGLPFAGALGGTDGMLADGGYLAQSGVGDLPGMPSGIEIEKQPTILQRMFGEAGEIDGYTKAWGTLEDAMVGGFNAIVTGSESAGSALKRIIGQSIMAEGARMLVMALREGAMAVASLATGNFAAAAGHGKAAAMFGAGAIAAAGVARSLGANEKGGWGGRPEDPKDPKASAGASASGVGLGGSSGGSDTRTTIVLGMGWDEESPRARAQRLARATRKMNIYDRATAGSQYG